MCFSRRSCSFQWWAASDLKLAELAFYISGWLTLESINVGGISCSHQYRSRPSSRPLLVGGVNKIRSRNLPRPFFFKAVSKGIFFLLLSGNFGGKLATGLSYVNFFIKNQGWTIKFVIRVQVQ